MAKVLEPSDANLKFLEKYTEERLGPFIDMKEKDYWCRDPDTFTISYYTLINNCYRAIACIHCNEDSMQAIAKPEFEVYLRK